MCEAPNLSGRLLTIEPDAARDGTDLPDLTDKVPPLPIVEKAFVVLSPGGEPVIAGIVLGSLGSRSDQTMAVHTSSTAGP